MQISIDPCLMHFQTNTESSIFRRIWYRNIPITKETIDHNLSYISIVIWSAAPNEFKK